VESLNVLLALPRALPALVRHLASYVELAGGELQTAVGEVRRRALYGALAAVAAFLSVLLLIGWILAATWDGPWRMHAFAALVAAFAIAAVVLFSAAARKPRPSFERLRREWAADRELLHRRIQSGEQSHG
jgi:uncharacterized membrane protein YqjE